MTKFNSVIIYAWPSRDSASASRLCRAIQESLPCLIFGKNEPIPNLSRNLNPLIINWGNSQYPVGHTDNMVYLNDPVNVQTSINKIKCFRTLQANGIQTCEYTKDATIAERWIRNGDIVLCRTRVSSYGGDGITVARKVSELIPSKFYVKYQKKTNEYRVHVFNGGVLVVHEKRRKNNTTYTKDQLLIRSDWAFCIMDNDPPREVCRAAIGAAEAAGLDFCGVDVGWNENYHQAVVYETNTAPAIRNSSVDLYAEAIVDFVTNNVLVRTGD